MSKEGDIKVRRLLQEFDHKLVEINKRNIRSIVGEISERDFLLLVEAISVCRARYLKQVLNLASGDIDDVSMQLSEQLLESGKIYHEAMRGFKAFRQALERGYFVLQDD